MKKYLSLIILCAVLVSGCTTQTTERGMKLVHPYVSALIAARENPTTYDAEGRARPSIETLRSRELLMEIFANETPEGDEAIAYLLFLYTGEFSGSGLVCEAAQRGERMAPIIRRNQLSLPKTGLEPYPESLQGSGVLAPRVLKLIRSGEQC